MNIRDIRWPRHAQDKVGAFVGAHKRYVLLAVTAFIVLVIAGCIVNAGAINRQFHRWKLLPEPERLTELYYENHTSLPATYTDGTPQSFAFTTHNLEYQNLTYTYQVTQSSADGTQTRELTNGTFYLTQNASHTQKITISPVDMGARSSVTTVVGFMDASAGGRTTGTNTQLPLHTESIHYWITKK